MTAAPVLEKIVSGGQTGVDRAALDAALAAGFPCGGWAPKGRMAEDGAIPKRYLSMNAPSPATPNAPGSTFAIPTPPLS